MGFIAGDCNAFGLFEVCQKVPGGEVPVQGQQES